MPGLPKLKPTLMPSHKSAAGPVEITAKDPSTGTEVTFVWTGQQPPTQADLAEVFASAQGNEPAPQAGHSGADAEGALTVAGSLSGATPPGAVAFGAMKAAPAMVTGMNRGAGLAGQVAATLRKSRAGRLAPTLVGLDAVSDVLQGKPGSAASKVGGAAALTAIPKLLNGLQGGSGAGSLLARGAGALSRSAGPLSLMLETILGSGSAGHRPAGETDATTARRQENFARQYADQVNRKAGRQVIQGNTPADLMAAIEKYRKR